MKKKETWIQRCKKVLLPILVMVLLCIAIPLFGAGSVYAEGTQDIVYDDATSTYEIYTAEGLSQFRDKVNGGQTSINGKLMADITFNADELANFADWGTTPPAQSWTPIGKDNTYNGDFDGQGYTIKGLYFKNNKPKEGARVGLFGQIQGSIIKNVTVAESYFDAYEEVGGIVGFASYKGTEIINCRNEAYVYADYATCGGICGSTSGDAFLTQEGVKIIGCSNYGNIVSRYSHAGGIAGLAERKANISNCYNVGDIEGSRFVAGIVGHTTGYTAVSNCYSTGNIKASSYYSYIYVTEHAYNTAENCYYLDDSLKAPEYPGTTPVTSEVFASGEVAYLLNGDQNTINFGQTISTDTYPVFISADNANQVHKITFKMHDAIDDTNTKYVYTNKNRTVTIPTEYADKKLVVLDADGNFTNTQFTSETVITADMKISDIPEPTYTVTIPTGVDFGDVKRVLPNKPEEEKIAIAENPITVEHSYLIGNRKMITITVDASNLKLTNETGTTLDYQLFTQDNTPITGISKCMEINPTQPDTAVTVTETLQAKLDQSQITEAGSYTGTLDFTVAFEDIQ